MLMVLLAALAIFPAVKAEHAYAALAQTRGQWSAFRATAAPGALMFVPQPVDAGTWLKGRADPPIAVMWWPSRAWMSCDRRLGINFGPWIRHGGKLLGTFTTVWSKQPDGSWRWQLDTGNVTPSAVAAGDAPKEEVASCRHLDAARRTSMADIRDRDAVILIGDTAPRAGPPPDATHRGQLLKAGASPDRSLRWEVLLLSRPQSAAHVFRAWRWDGRGYRLILFESADAN